jgi:hypothetical protein
MKAYIQSYPNKIVDYRTSGPVIFHCLRDRTKFHWSLLSVVSKLLQNITGLRSSDRRTFTGPDPNFFIQSPSPVLLAMTVYFKKILFTLKLQNFKNVLLFVAFNK